MYRSDDIDLKRAPTPLHTYYFHFLSGPIFCGRLGSQDSYILHYTLQFHATRIRFRIFRNKNNGEIYPVIFSKAHVSWWKVLVDNLAFEKFEDGN